MVYNNTTQKQGGLSRLVVRRTSRQNAIYSAKEKSFRYARHLQKCKWAEQGSMMLNLRRKYRQRLKAFVLWISLQSAQTPCRGMRAAWAVLPEELFIPLPAVVWFLHSDHCLDLPWKTLAFEAAAIAHGAKERKESCQKSKVHFCC